MATVQEQAVTYLRERGYTQERAELLSKDLAGFHAYMLEQGGQGPCSACGDGDVAQKYHIHAEPAAQPNAEMVEVTAQPVEPRELFRPSAQVAPGQLSNQTRTYRGDGVEEFATIAPVNFVQVSDPATEGNPNCHVCGAAMTPVYHNKSWRCKSCGATMEPSPAVRDGAFAPLLRAIMEPSAAEPPASASGMPHCNCGAGEDAYFFCHAVVCAKRVEIAAKFTHSPAVLESSLAQAAAREIIEGMETGMPTSHPDIVGWLEEILSRHFSVSQEDIVRLEKELEESELRAQSNADALVALHKRLAAPQVAGPRPSCPKSREEICEWTREWFERRKVTREDFDLPSMISDFGYEFFRGASAANITGEQFLAQRGFADSRNYSSTQLGPLLEEYARGGAPAETHKEQQ